MLPRPEASLFLRLIMALVSSLVEKLLAKSVFEIVRLSALGCCFIADYHDELHRAPPSIVSKYV